MTLKAVTRKVVHTPGSLIAQRWVQSHIYLCRFSKSHITTCFAQFTSTMLSFKILHMHYYIPPISAKSPSLVQDCRTMNHKFKSPCKSAPGSWWQVFKAIWANLIIWGPMCSSKQILHFFLYPPTIQMKMEIFWKLCPNLKGQISRFHIRPPDLYSGVLVCCTIWLSGLQLILTMQYVIMTVVWFITQRYHLQWVRQIWLTELHIQIW